MCNRFYISGQITKDGIMQINVGSRLHIYYQFISNMSYMFTFSTWIYIQCIISFPVQFTDMLVCIWLIFVSTLAVFTILYLQLHYMITKTLYLPMFQPRDLDNTCCNIMNAKDTYANAFNTAITHSNTLFISVLQLATDGTYTNTQGALGPAHYSV